MTAYAAEPTVISVEGIEVAPHNPEIAIAPPSYWDHDETPAQPSFAENKWDRRRQELGRMMAAGFYGFLSRSAEFEHTRAHHNEEQQKFIRSIVDTGPDMDVRAIFAERGSDGLLRTYDGKTIVPGPIYKAQFLKCRRDPHQFQARAAHEITKWEEQEQEPGWQRIMDKGAELGYNEHEVLELIVGLQFMNKASILTVKHSGFREAYIRDREGNVIMDPVTRPVLDRRGRPQYRQYRDMRDLDRKGRPKIKYELITEPVLDREVVLDENGKTVTDNNGNKLYYAFADDDSVITTSNPNADFCVRVKQDDGMPKLDEHGNYVFEQRQAKKPRQSHTRYELGELNVRAYATELADKFPQGYRFSTYDVVKAKKAAFEAFEVLAKYHNDPHMVRTPEFRNALYIMSRFRLAVESSKMGSIDSASDPSGKEMSAEQLAQANAEVVAQINAARLAAEAAAAGAPQLAIKPPKMTYPPKIYGSATANKKWAELAEITDKAAQIWPVIDTVLDSDYVTIKGRMTDMARTKK